MHSLSPEEMDNPYLVIEEFFDFADVSEIRTLLWEWLKTTVTGAYPKHLSRTERATLLDLYEKMEKLVEAAYILKTKARK